MSFAEPMLDTTISIKAFHFDELRVAINAVRELAGLSPIVFAAQPLNGVPIKKMHIDQLRTGPNDALNTLMPEAVTSTANRST